MMEQYTSHLEQIVEQGHFNPDRTGKFRLRLPGIRMRSYDLEEGFPIITTKRVPFKMVTKELFWFLSGDTKLSTLLDHDISIWTPDAMNRYRRSEDADLDMNVSDFEQLIKTDEEFRAQWDDLGPIYGYQFRRLSGIDQIARSIGLVESDPFGSKNLTTAWNPHYLGKVALEACHASFQILDYGDGLELAMDQRSADMVLGVPFNIASYALLTHLIAEATSRKAKAFHHIFKDDHIYGDHLPVAVEQLAREPRPLPTLALDERSGEFLREVIRGGVDDPLLESVKLIKLEGYDPHPWLWAPLHTGVPDHLMKDADRRASYYRDLERDHPAYVAALTSDNPRVVPFMGREIPVKYREDGIV